VIKSKISKLLFISILFFSSSCGGGDEAFWVRSDAVNTPIGDISDFSQFYSNLQQSDLESCATRNASSQIFSIRGGQRFRFSDDEVGKSKSVILCMKELGWTSSPSRLIGP
jgi:hypothetical protein